MSIIIKSRVPVYTVRAMLLNVEKPIFITTHMNAAQRNELRAKIRGCAKTLKIPIRLIRLEAVSCDCEHTENLLLVLKNETKDTSEIS